MRCHSRVTKITEKVKRLKNMVASIILYVKNDELKKEVNGESYGQGTGHSKQAAAKSAARQALKKLGIS